VITTLRRVVDRTPFASPWVVAIISKYGLPFWFGIESALGIAVAAQDTKYWFFDARLYLDATRVWLAGGDPWAVQLAGNYFAAPPPTLLAFAPLTLLPDGIAVGLVAAAVVLGGVATIRLLHLPWWWLLFPPLVQCVLSANVQSLIVPMILLPAGGLAVILKIYAGLPLAILGRWRSLLIAAVVIVVTAPFLPWATYISEFAVISENLADQSKLTLPMGFLLLVSPLVLVALVVVGRERAAWLIVPAIWPSQQFYYGTIALPAKSKIALALIALPVPGNGLLALGALALVTWSSGDHVGWRSFDFRRRGVEQALPEPNP
jgi:hypothetical protein